MKKKKRIILCLAVLGTLLNPFGAAWAQYTFSLTFTSDGITPITWLEPDESFYVDIGISNAGGVAGCAVTLEYPGDMVIPPNIREDGLSQDITSPFPFVFNSTDTHRGNITNPARLHLAGAAIDTENGGALYTAGPVKLFRVGFTVDPAAEPGAISFTLKETELWNPSAGYGLDTDGSGVYDPVVDEMGKVTVLVGAAKNNHAAWDDLTLAFPVLLPDPPYKLAEASLYIVDPTTYIKPEVDLSEDYEGTNPTTWPMVNSGESITFQASGGTGSGYSWAVEGPAPVDSSAGATFEFKAPIDGPFAGVYTVTLKDDASGDNYSFYVKVPMTLLPHITKMNEDPVAKSFWVEGAPQGTGLSVSLVTPSMSNMENTDETTGKVARVDSHFDAYATAEFYFTPAETVGENKAFRFRVEAVENGVETPLTDAG